MDKEYISVEQLKKYLQNRIIIGIGGSDYYAGYEAGKNSAIRRILEDLDSRTAFDILSRETKDEPEFKNIYPILSEKNKDGKRVVEMAIHADIENEEIEVIVSYADKKLQTVNSFTYVADEFSLALVNYRNLIDTHITN